MDRAEIAKVLTKVLGDKHTEADITGARPESTGATIVTTSFGNKVRITTKGDVEVLVGPGSEADLLEPPELAVDSEPQSDLPPLEGTPAAPAPAGPTTEEIGSQDAPPAKKRAPRKRSTAKK